jgi:hypothetical protein
LILSNERDVSADWVVRELRRRHVPFKRLNTEHLANLSFTVDPVTPSWVVEDVAGRLIDLASVRSVWFRRPDPPGPVAGVTPSENDLLRNQWRSAINAFCDPFAHRLINDPAANRQAELKILQLSIATRVGFFVPKTLVTNDRAKAASFLRETGRTGVVKALDAPYLEEQSRFMYTQRVDSGTINGMAEIEAVPLIFQEEILDKRDVRVTVIGERVFAAIATRTDTVDWRAAEPRPTFQVHTIEDEIAARCRRMTADLGLTFSAIDLTLGSRGDYHFLEINPNGEWGWLQKSLGLPIAESIVDELCAFGAS